MPDETQQSAPLKVRPKAWEWAVWITCGVLMVLPEVVLWLT